ncbi:MAG: sulfur globule protein CV1, partial [Sedimenticola sp.]|nr:sulfur globule protein CV1 [Sedimenticola sp.]
GGPWNGLGDGFGDGAGDFNMNFSGRSNVYGTGRGYGYHNPYYGYGYAPYGAPYGYAPYGAPYGYPVAPVAPQAAPAPAK